MRSGVDFMYSHRHSVSELKENLQHGTQVFPVASYIWKDNPYDDHRVPVHWHPEVELMRFVGGRFELALDAGEPFIHEGPGLLLVPGNILHTLVFHRHCHQGAVVFNLDLLYFEHYDEVESDIFEALQTGNMPLPQILTPADPDFERADTLARLIIDGTSETSAAARLTLKARLLELIALFYAHGLITRKAPALSEKHGDRQNRLKDLLSYIDAHYAGPLTVGDAAARLKVSEQYFCRYFKKVTGLSFTAYLNDLRLRRAATDILKTEESIATIAEHHGFDNTGYFFKNFKKKFGITPLKYRKTQRKEQQPATDALIHAVV